MQPLLRLFVSSKILLAGAFALLSVSFFQTAMAQVLFSDSLESDGAWSLISENISDSSAEFGFDYSAFGIPEAPNTPSGDASTSGLRMRTNIDFGQANSVAAFPTGMSFSGKFTYQFDMWINAVGPFPLGGSGSTEHAGGGVAFDNSTLTPLSGAAIHVSGEGGDGQDYRLYADDEFQLLATHNDPETEVNDLYAPELETANIQSSGSDPYLAAAFPGLQPPATQQSAAPNDQTGTTFDGVASFQWMTVKYTVDTEAGTAKVEMTSATSGETAQIGTFTLDNTYVDRTTIDEKIITSLEGNISLIYRDRFASLIDIEPVDLTEYSFGLFDNVIVQEIPDGLAGDYSNDGIVNIADYVVWRNNLGAAIALPNETATPGVVDVDDYEAWKENFGAVSGSLAGLSSAVVPEPSAWTCMALLALVGVAYRRR